MKILNKYKIYLVSILVSTGLLYYSNSNFSVSSGMEKLDEVIDCKTTIAANKSEVEYKQNILSDMQILSSKVKNAADHRMMYSEMDILGKIGELTNQYKSVKLIGSKYLVDYIDPNANNNQAINQTVQTPTPQASETQSSGLDIPTAQTAQTASTETEVTADTTTEITDESTQSSLTDSVTGNTSSEQLLNNVTEFRQSDTLFTQVYDDSYKYLNIVLKSDNSTELINLLSDLESLSLRYKYLNIDVGFKYSTVELIIYLV